MSQESQNTPQKPPGWRMAIAIVLIAISLGAPAFIPLVTSSGLSTEMKTLLSGLLVVGIPQLLMVSAVAPCRQTRIRLYQAASHEQVEQAGPFSRSE